VGSGIQTLSGAKGYNGTTPPIFPAGSSMWLAIWSNNPDGGYGYSGTGSLQISTVLEAIEVSITPGAENWLGARLLDQRGRVLVGAPLFFSVDGNALGTGSTDNRGFVWIPYWPGTSNKLSLTVAFNGAEGYAVASDTVQIAAPTQDAPLQQYAIIAAVAAATLGVVTVLVYYRRRMSQDLTESLREDLGESDHKYY
jgi:hypothetical protein